MTTFGGLKEAAATAGRLALFFAFTTVASGAGLTLEIIPAVPSGVAFVGEEARYTLKVQRPAPEAEARLELIPPGEKAAWAVTRPLPVLTGEGVALPTDAPGYWAVRAAVLVGGQETDVAESGFLVVPRSATFGRIAPGSFFGTMFIRDAEAAARIGVRFERVEAAWGWIQPEGQDEYAWTGLDNRLEQRHRHGIGTVLVIRPEKAPRWVRWRSLEELSEPEHLESFKGFVRAVASRYRDRVQAVEIVNEPDLEVMRSASGRVPGPEIYARLLRAGHAASKEVAPDLPVIGLDVSGVDVPGLRFSEAVLRKAAGHLDINGVHPYNHSRYLGGDARPESPLRMDAAGRFRAVADLMERHGAPRRIWSTEFGWALHLDEPMASPPARLHAAFTAQAILLSRSVPAVEKLFWFAATFPGRERSSSYGLFRKADERKTWNQAAGNWFPSPSAAAYATCARFLENVTPAGGFKLGTVGQVLRFEGADETVFALWVEDMEAAGGGGTLRLPADRAADFLAVDALGRGIKAGRELALDSLPVFLSTARGQGDALEHRLRSSTIEAREKLVLQSVFVPRAGQLAVSVVNNDHQPASVKLYPEGESSGARSRLLAPGITPVVIPAALRVDEPARTAVVLLDERSGRSLCSEVAYHLHALPHRSAGARADIVLSTRDQVLPADPGVDWKGPDDLSAAARVSWSEAGLQLDIRVTDDVHHGPTAGVTDLWNYDAVQVAFDFGNRADYGYDDDCREVSLALTPAGPVAVVDGQIVPAGGSRIRREGTTTFYELRFSWSDLRRPAPEAGEVFRMNFIVNDSDGGRRKCWIGLTSGIGEAKRPTAFRQWVLQPQ